MLGDFKIFLFLCLFKYDLKYNWKKIRIIYVFFLNEKCRFIFDLLVNDSSIIKFLVCEFYLCRCKFIIFYIVVIIGVVCIDKIWIFWVNCFIRGVKFWNKIKCDEK